MMGMEPLLPGPVNLALLCWDEVEELGIEMALWGPMVLEELEGRGNWLLTLCANLFARAFLVCSEMWVWLVDALCMLLLFPVL